MDLPQALVATQDRLATLLGCEPDRRPLLLSGMLHRGAAEVTGYWVQLLIAAGIASLGLALGSNAVIIGAMLVAPLMGPIVGLGMGLASGSPVLVLRATGRVLVSVVAVVSLSAGLTRLLPFHEINAEIAARTTPTALDLGVAVFCAMAGVFATMRPASDVATTAAGTSIGISLVPPLCVSGYGLGIASWHVARGAALLFLTNFAAIILVASVAFAAAGFARADVARLEEAELNEQPNSWVTGPVGRRITAALRAGAGPWLRLLMPIALLAALYSPLRRGLDEVAWQITTRGEVERAIQALPNRVVQARVQVERRGIQVQIFLLGSQADARAARESLTKQIGAAGEVAPFVEVFAVADAAEFEALERTAQRLAVPAVGAAPPVEPEPPSPAEVLGEAREATLAVVESRWPLAAGELVRVDIDASGPEVGIRLTHLGPPLDPIALETLSSVLADDLASPIDLSSDAMPAEPVGLDEIDAATFARVARALTLAASTSGVVTCSRWPKTPPKGTPRNTSPAARVLRDAVAQLLATQPRVVSLSDGPAALWFTRGTCSSKPPEP